MDHCFRRQEPVLAFPQLGVAMPIGALSKVRPNGLKSSTLSDEKNPPIHYGHRRNDSEHSQ